MQLQCKDSGKTKYSRLNYLAFYSIHYFRIKKKTGIEREKSKHIVNKQFNLDLLLLRKIKLEMCSLKKFSGWRITFR